jgi:TfoX/Sxy family transcriptional regulator of competence genes
MPVDQELRGRVRDHLKGMQSIEEKPMFGGTCFMWRGNLLCGVMQEDLLVRVAKKDYDRFIGDQGARPMVMGGRSGKSWILVHKSVVADGPVMDMWLDRAREFVGSLPAK